MQRYEAFLEAQTEAVPVYTEEVPPHPFNHDPSGSERDVVTRFRPMGKFTELPGAGSRFAVHSGDRNIGT